MKKNSEPETRMQLEKFIAEETSKPLAVVPNRWVDFFKKQPGIAAILFYGSGLRNHTPDDEIVYDFYLLVERFCDYKPNLPLAIGGRLVPPNVYFFEETFEGAPQRCKVAVLRIDQFCKAATRQSFTPHIWARFCQPCRIAFTNSDSARQTLIRSIADCVLTFHEETLHLINSCSVTEFWEVGLRSTYADEIRSEKQNRARLIFETNAESCTEKSRLAIPQLNSIGEFTNNNTIYSKIPGFRKSLYVLKRRFSRPFKKGVILLRLIKATFTFQGNIDYARWKIERHSGVKVEISEFHRRHPILGGLALFLRVTKRGGIR
ncbi:MAG: hypothetical protein ACK5NG_08100 [Chthoniobacterales bacterium]